MIDYAAITAELSETNPNALLLDGFEDALIGVTYRFGMDPVALYDMNKCLHLLEVRDGMLPEEAQEYFDFNIIGAWMGEGTPAFASLPFEVV